MQVLTDQEVILEQTDEMDKTVVPDNLGLVELPEVPASRVLRASKEKTEMKDPEDGKVNQVCLDSPEFRA
jgi:hypothetical protein